MNSGIECSFNMPKKYILEFATYAGSGGTQQEILKLVRHISLDKYVVCVCVLLRHGLLNEEASKLHIENISFNMRGYWDLTAWWKFYKFAKSRHIDLMRTYGLKAHIIGRIVGKLFLRIPVIITSIHSTDPWKKWYHILLGRLTSGLTDLYISNSEAGRLATHRREHIPLSKIITIPNGINLSDYAAYHARIHEISITYKQQFGLIPKTPVIGIVANLRKMKGHKTIVDALPKIQHHVPEVKCLFVGEDLVNQEIHSYVQEKQLDQSIIFTGLRNDIPEILTMLNVFLLPSVWEGLPTSILEAMAMKKPVVASSVGGIPELVEHEKTGWLIPPDNHQALADAVIFLLTHPDIAVNMGQAGYKKVRQRFCTESVIAKTESVYNHLIEQSREK